MKIFTLHLLLVALLFTSTAVADEMVLVVNKNNPVASLSKQDAKMIYLGKKKSWDDGNKIMLYSQYDFVARDTFSKKIINKSGQQFATYWKKALFTGTGRPPVEVKDDTEMKKFISADPRGIGYISAATLDSSVKVVAIR